MDPIYFDNAATSWPKPPGVRAALDACFGASGGNPGRSGHHMSINASRLVEAARDAVADLFMIADPVCISFTRNATEALNLAIYGSLQAGDHVITTSLEHNSVMRPLRDLEQRGLSLTVLRCSAEGLLDLDALRAAFKPHTRLVVCTHGSNVIGSLMPLAEIAAITHEQGALLLIDAAQTAGTVPINLEELGVDMLAFTGHKGPLGLTGTGGLFVRQHVHLRPLMRGGTGSDSASEYQPEFLPDRYESGTPNTVGLAGLEAGIRHVLNTGVANILAHERSLVRAFIEASRDIPRMRVYGPADPEQRCGVVSFNIEGLVPSEVGVLLEQHFNILCRPGLHCAPGAHHTLGTFPTGTVRFSFGIFNTLDEVRRACEGLREIASSTIVQ